MRYENKKLLLPIIAKRKFWKVILSLIFFILTSISLFYFKSYAQVPVNYDVTVSPVFFDYSQNPGVTISDKIRIRNNTASPLPIKLGVKKMAGDVNGEVTLKSDTTDTSLSWIHFQSNTIVARPLEWTDVPFTIEVSKDAAYGYYFAITFAQDNTSPFAKTGASITGAAAVPILLDVRKEGAKAEAKIVNFSTGSFVSEYLPIDFTVKIANAGNIHLSPRGNIFISGGGNKDLAILDINTTQGNIIPQTNRTFITSWDDGFLVNKPVLVDNQPKLDKSGKQETSLVVNWDKLTSFRIGKYTANLLLVYDNGKRDVPLQSTISFWVFPYKAVIVILIGFVIGVLALRYLLRIYVKKQIQKVRSTK